MVKVTITADALEDLQNIKHFYKEYPGKEASIRKKIVKVYKLLETFPKAGPVEMHFEDRSITYRSLVIDKDFKLIYYIEEEIIYIVGIWDCRQDPLKIFDRLYPSC